ncbi:MAG: DUF4854 domain-containing protein [Firmicutes bacterium]|nr:DUF4854 domain-containing protein [Bacillota bacterium]
MRNNRLNSGVIISLMIVMIIMLSGCASQPATLEEYISNDEEARTTLESVSSSTEGLEVDVEDNTIIYTYTYDNTLDSSMIESVSQQLEKTIDSSESTFRSMADTLEEESGIDGITIRVIYLNNDGTELVNKEY